MDAKHKTKKTVVTHHKDTPASPVLSEEYRKLHARPWLRFIARSIDLYLFGIILSGVLLVINPNYFNDFLVGNLNKIYSIVIIFGWFVAEPFVLFSAGTTLGKYLLKIKLSDLQGKKPQLNNLFHRSFGVWYNGYGFGLPIISIFTLFFSYRCLHKTGVTSWDKERFIVTHGEIGYARASLIFLVLAVSPLLVIWGAFEYNLLTPNSVITQ